MRCPNCHPTQPDADTPPHHRCPYCGVAREVPRAAPATPSSAPSARSMRRASLGDVMRYGAVLAALLPAAKSCWTRVDPLNLLLLVPLYFTLIPVLTHLVLGEMWDWNTRTSNFERFDVTAHPVAGKLLMLFYTVCSAVFVYLVLTFDPGRIK